METGVGTRAGAGHALSLVALPSFAEGEESTGTGTAVTGGSTNTPGLELRKVYDPSKGLLTLEAYATGSTTTTTTTDPVDIVLVLDVSGSMKDSISDKYDYYETYSIDTDGTYYYKDNNGQYQQAYYCDGEYYSWGWKSHHTPGWYTKDHQYLGQCQGESGMPLTPKTSSADTAGTQFYTHSKLTKMNALKTAVKGFVNSVNETSPDSNIAIVKFGAEINDKTGNDFNDSGWNYTQIVKELTPASNAAELNAEIDTLRYGGYTPAHLGLQLANEIIQKDPNKDRQKVVVLFTDGEPNGVNSTSGFETSAANKAIANSKSIKGAGATVYTIGCFGTLTGGTKTKVDTYMNYVSSNYPEATNMNNGGDRGVGDYYKTVSSAADLNNIFQDISHTVGGATLTLGSQTVLKDVVSKYFDLPENAADNITAQSYSCIALDADGAPIWNETPDQGTNYAVSIQDKTISVTGFDYSANWVGKDTTTGVMHTPGKKLVVTIPIQDNGTGMGEVPTNGTDSAVYDKDGKQVCPFAQPTAYFPYFTVTHIQSKVDDNGKNYGKNDHFTKHRVPKNGEKFNLTSVVTENHLYGGSFTGENCDTVQTYGNGENPTAFTPQDKAEYFIWEVPNTYLTPRNYNVWRHLPENNGQKTVVRLYPLTAADRTLYKQVGFVIDDKDYVSGCGEFGTAINNAPTLYQTAVAEQNGQHYQTLYLDKGAISATNTAIGDDGLVKAQHIDDGCLAGIRLNDNGMAKFQSNSGVTFRPYWITLDNVKVYGATARTCTYVANSTTAMVTDANNPLPCEYVGDTVATQAMSFAKSFTMDDSQPAVDESLTVTVVDAAKTYELTVSAGTGVRDQVAYQAPAGKIFAGWFADQAYTTPADLDQVTQDTTIYAKYVSDSYLDLDYSRTGLFRLRGVTLISAVDNPANYQASGIIVNGDKLNVSYASRYRIFKTPASLFGAARNAKLMLAEQPLNGTGTLEVTPYWVTLDGTQVLGQTHTLHYNTRTIWE